MADDIYFENARFATQGMMPKTDEEINALWGRKIAWNTGRSVGEWATVVLESSGVDLAAMREYFNFLSQSDHDGWWTLYHAGTYNVNYSSLGFNTIPSVDAYIYDANYGTFYPPFYGQQLSAVWGAAGNRGTVTLFQYRVDPSAENVWFNACYPDPSFNLYGSCAFWVFSGTVIYRLRGW